MNDKDKIRSVHIAELRRAIKLSESISREEKRALYNLKDRLKRLERESFS